MKFSEMPYKRPDPEALIAALKDLTEKTEENILDG